MRGLFRPHVAPLQPEGGRYVEVVFPYLVDLGKMLCTTVHQITLIAHTTPMVLGSLLWGPLIPVSVGKQVFQQPPWHIPKGCPALQSGGGNYRSSPLEETWGGDMQDGRRPYFRLPRELPLFGRGLWWLRGKKDDPTVLPVNDQIWSLAHGHGRGTKFKDMPTRMQEWQHFLSHRWSDLGIHLWESEELNILTHVRASMCTTPTQSLKLKLS